MWRKLVIIILNMIYKQPLIRIILDILKDLFNRNMKQVTSSIRIMNLFDLLLLKLDKIMLG